MHTQLSVVLIFWKLSVSIATENIHLIITQSVMSTVKVCCDKTVTCLLPTLATWVIWSVGQCFIYKHQLKTSAIKFLSCIHMKNIVPQKCIFESVL